jgi:hypothetical protein
MFRPNGSQPKAQVPGFLRAAPVFAALATLIVAGSASAGLPQTGPVPEFAVPVIESLPVLDGELGDECWEQALVSSAFYPVGTTTPAGAPSDRTTIHLARLGQSLLVGVACRDGGNGIKGDAVTVFLDPLHCHEFTYNFVVRSDGTSALDTWADPDWLTMKDNWECAITTTDNGWSAEMRIHLANLPYLRRYNEAVGMLVTREVPDNLRLVWALNRTEQGLVPRLEGYESFWACHLTGLNVPGLVQVIDEENRLVCAPLQPRLGALRRVVDRVLNNETLSDERRLRAVSLAIWLEDLDPTKRLYVERVARRGLAERELFLKQAELLASMLMATEPGAGENSDPLARLAADPDGPARLEIDVGRPIERFRGRGALLGVSYAGLPLAAMQEEIARDTDTFKERIESREKWPRQAGLEVRHESRDGFDVCVVRRPAGPETISYVSRGRSIYESAMAVPNGHKLIYDALLRGQPVDAALVDRLLQRLPLPVKIEDAEGLLAFPLTEAALVIPASIEETDADLTFRLQQALELRKLFAYHVPADGNAVVIGTGDHDEAIREAGFPVDEWRNEAPSGRVALRRDGGRAIVAIFGRDVASAERAAAILRDLRSVLSERQMLVGDLHAHSILSDGSGSPRQVLLAMLAAGLDFGALTDHNKIAGSLEIKEWSDRWDVGFTAIKGEEVLGRDFEVLALGIGTWVTPQPDIRKLVAEVHAQSGTALLCHPFDEMGARLVQECDTIGLDGIDRWTEEAAHYLNEREMIGRHPVVTEVTDAHQLTFGYPSRTIVFARDTSEQGILRAIRKGYYVTLGANGIMGSARLVDVTLAIIGERELISHRYHERIVARLARLSAAWRAGVL